MNEPPRRRPGVRRATPKREPRLSTPRLPGELGEPVAVGDAAARVGRELGLGDAAAITRVRDGWEGMVGPAIAAHAWPQAIRDGVLVVGVDAPAWATQLRYLEAELLAGARTLLGSDGVRSVQVVVGAEGR